MEQVKKMAETTSTGQSSSAKASDTTTNDNLLVVDIGKRQRRKRIRQLRKGRGKLFEKVKQVVADLREEGAIDAKAQPVVIVVREKDGLSLGGMRW